MRNYLIIGGSSGIGKALAEQLHKAGHRLYVTYLTHKEQSTDSVTYVKWDALNDSFDDSLLPDTLDGLVYCPGSINLKPFNRFSEDDFVRDFRLQVVGAVRVIQSVVSRLKASGRGAIVLFSTVAVQRGFPFHAQVSVSKGAIEGLTRSLAAEFAPHIRVNAIAPSLTDTPLAEKLLNTEQKRMNNSERNPLKRIGSVNDVAGAAQFLLSDESAWVTGQILHIDGGMSTIMN